VHELSGQQGVAMSSRDSHITALQNKRRKCKRKSVQKPSVPPLKALMSYANSMPTLTDVEQNMSSGSTQPGRLQPGFIHDISATIISF
jgi:hypothetical protein